MASLCCDGKRPQPGIEVGDVEGAREILDEVIRDGAPEHQEHARELLAKLVD